MKPFPFPAYLSRIPWASGGVIDVKSFVDSIPHGLVSALTLVPHPQQRRVARVDKIDDPHVSLVGMLPVKPAGVLLQSTLPRHRHRQHQGIQRWMVEALPNQLAGREQYARCFRG